MTCAYILNDVHQEMDAWYNTKFQDLNKVTSRHVESARSVREEITGYKKEV